MAEKRWKKRLEFNFSDNYENWMFNCFLHNVRSVRNKKKEIKAFLQINQIIIGICVRSWVRIKIDDNFFLQQYCPSGFKFQSAPRLNKSGRGICLFYRSNIQLENFESQSSELFESCFATLKIQESIFCLIIVYRVPGRSVTTFIDNFSDFLKEKTLRFDGILLIGNFNISLNVNNYASQLWALFMEEFGLIQHVKSQTHKSGGHFIHDHFISSGEIRINVISNTFLTQFDHFVFR